MGQQDTGSFDNIDHEVLLSILAERIHDNRFLRLIRNGLKAGYFEKEVWYPTRSGTPQGGVASPILSNIYLDRLDKFVEQTLLPRYTQGERRRNNRQYRRIGHQRETLRRTGRWADDAQLRKKMQQLPSLDPNDPDYRRLRFVRYADDFILGFAGPRQEAEEIKVAIRDYLRDNLKLKLSEEKTHITHARTEAARFLGYEIITFQSDSKQTGGGRSINGNIGFRVPLDVIEDHCRPYMKRGKAVHRPEWTSQSAYAIIAHYQQVYRGLVEYYRKAYNLRKLGKLKWVMETSLTKTLARKYKISVSKVYDRYGTTLETPDGPYKVLQVQVTREGREPLTATWGAIPLKWNAASRLTDPAEPYWLKSHLHSDLLQRLLADQCELCGDTDHVQVHHVKRLSNLKQKGRTSLPLWKKAMIARQRKTLVVCHACHGKITAQQRVEISQHRQRQRKRATGKPDDAKVSRPVWRGADGKVPPPLASSR